MSNSTFNFVNSEPELAESSVIPVCEKRAFEKRVIPGFEKYQVDTLGNIYGQNGEKLRQKFSPRGEASVSLYTSPGNKTTRRVHCLALLAFVGPPPSSEHTGDHINRLPWQNNIENFRPNSNGHEDIALHISDTVADKGLFA